MLFTFTRIASMSGMKAVAFENLIEFKPALSTTGIVTESRLVNDPEFSPFRTVSLPFTDTVAERASPLR